MENQEDRLPIDKLTKPIKENMVGVSVSFPNPTINQNDQINLWNIFYIINIIFYKIIFKILKNRSESKIPNKKFAQVNEFYMVLLKFINKKYIFNNLPKPIAQCSTGFDQF